MRMRRKKNLEQRLSEVGDILICAEARELNFNKVKENAEYIDLKKWFNNNNPIYLEIGCGKGKFATEFALKNPNINLVAVEKSSNVIVDACNKAIESGIENLRFIKCGAEYLECFIKPKMISRLFLNFSCPFPKKAYAKHRLTSPLFLNIYKSILKDDAEIHQKTDNMNFFEYSIEQFSNNGFSLKNISLDLHNSDYEGNIVTEYESKFVSLGLPIYKLEAFISKK